MKLSEKCKNSLKAFGVIYGVGEALSLIDNYEFEADDFQGAVVLTVEEAKTLVNFFYTIKNEMPNGGCMEYCDLWGNTIKKRIEQAEKKK